MSKNPTNNNCQYLYLHGFASSPESTKALYFSEQFRQIPIPLTVINFNEPDFANLSLSRQIDQVSNIINHNNQSNFILIGSSFGGLTTNWLANKYPQNIKALILLAPAFDFFNHLKNIISEQILEEWKKQGFLSIYHYGYKKEMPLKYHFWTDLLSYDESSISHSIPTLIFHGIYDETIPIESSRNYIKKHSNATLQELNSNHSLNDCLFVIWQELQIFLEDK
ncbi:hypothetical protein GM3708_2607 [Geminocystis sp. NIES-3708]|uniref:YqiA/YcfP family alpha/beta fold hydrolase n=1 Tax=Geminocystis sp. NIES-3708 TaxID=1615909 RepID=UPI0005FCCD0B|nr:YqiA/YcfP family alpha/beta fold hydrolase [Geminocystis sp. NIES-3708]BAQ62201.1 hypothetical protein GM3708_2607 [Geminocystis sp. NIES-3708]